MRCVCFGSLLLVLPFASSEQPPNPEAAVKARVELLLAALQEGDHAKALADWPPDSPGRAALQKILPAMFVPTGYTGTIEDHGYTAWKLGEKEVTVRFHYVVWAKAKKGNDQYRSTIAMNARFVRSGGGWAWASCTHAATDAADAIRKATTRAEASRILKDNADIVPRQLARLLLRHTIATADSFEIASARVLRDALFELATERGDLWPLTRFATGVLSRAKIRPYAEYAAGVVARAEGKAEVAAAAFGRSSQGFMDLASPREQLDAMSRRLDALLTAGLFMEAEQEGAASLALARKLNDPVSMAQAISNHGFALRAIGKYSESLDAYRAALKIEREHKLPEERMTLNKLGEAERLVGNNAAATEALQLALKLSEAAGDDRNCGYVLLNLAAVAHDEARYDDAVDLARKGGELFRKLRFPYGIMSANNALAMVRMDRGEVEEALAVFRESYNIARATGNVPAMGTALLNIGLCQRRLGLYSDALITLHQVAEGTFVTGDRPMEAKVHQHLGSLLLELGDHPRARYHAARSALIARQIGDRKIEAEALLLKGGLEYSWGRADEGRRDFLRSQQISREIGLLIFEVSATVNLAVYDQKTGQHDAAVRVMREMMARVALLKNQAMEQEVRVRLGLILLRAGRLDEAAAEFAKLQDTAIPVQRQDTRHLAGLGLGLVAVAHKDWKAGIPHFRTAVEVNERLRQNVRGPETRMSQFAEQSMQGYQGLARCLAELGRNAEAFEVSEHAKGRTLSEILQNGQVLLTRGVTAQERTNEQELVRLVTERTNALDAMENGKAAPETVAEARRMLDVARDRVTNYRRLLYAAHPELHTARAEFAPTDLEQLGATLFRDRPGLVVLSYFVDDNHTLLFVLRAGAKPGDPARLTIHGIDVKKDELDKEVTRYVDLCTRTVAQPVTRDLVRWLLPATDEAIAGAKELVVIPDGPLHKLPFQALREKGGPYLIERYAVSYAPSVTALARMTELADRRRKDRDGPATLLAVGISNFGERERPLEEAESEARAIAEQLQNQPNLDPGKPLVTPKGPPTVTTLLGREATKPNVQAAWAARRYLHFATHGQCNPMAPLYSSVLLTPAGANDDGRLYGRDLLDVEITAELVVLSACQTGQGTQLQGEGLLGLGWAWFVAGAPSLVASQWNVADESTARLMKEFYDRLIAGSTKAEALRAAQLGLLRDRKTRHPFFWAPFVLLGDSK